MNDLLEKASKGITLVFGIPLAILLILIVLYSSSDSFKNFMNGIVGSGKTAPAAAAETDEEDTGDQYSYISDRTIYDQDFTGNAAQDDTASDSEPFVVYVDPDRQQAVTPVIPGSNTDTDDTVSDHTPYQSPDESVPEYNDPSSSPDAGGSLRKVEVAVRIDENAYDRTLEYDSRGLLIKEKYSFDDKDGLDDDGCTTDYTYDENNRLIKAVVTVPGYGAVDTYEYTYDSQGRRTGYSRNGRDMTGYIEYTGTEPRDSHGNLLKDKYNDYTLTYDGDRLTERVSSNTEKITYSYKEIEVDEKYIDEIKKQQWSLINEDADCYFGVVVGWG